MDKERKDKLKRIEKDFIKKFKSIAKTYNYKSISNSLYKRVGGYFLHTVFFSSYGDNGLSFKVWNYIKSYESDNLFWTIFEMEENINEKDSLRANGAYTMPSFKIGEYSKELDELTNLDELSHIFLKQISSENSHFIESVCKNTEIFNRNLLEQKGYLREELIKMIAHVELHNFKDAQQMAMKEIGKGNRGGFCNGDKDIYQYILEYCEKQ